LSASIKKIQRRAQINLEDYQFSDKYSPTLQQVFAARGALSDQDLVTSLDCLLKPGSLKGLDEALPIIVEALNSEQKILIVGDFDADGATSSALAVLALRAMGAKHVDFLVPNRFEYGYGLTPKIVEVAKKFDPDLIITVDNGISSIEGVLAANLAGIKVLVTDHHLPGKELPDAAAIVNPNQLGCKFPSKNLAGVGVIFYVMSALRTTLRASGWFERHNIDEPLMADYLDLVALGTVADVVPLDGNNRILVAQGLRRIRAGRARPGIKALLQVARRNINRVVSSDLAFAIGPRLNAVGRLDDMSLGIQCLISDDEYLTQEIATQMDGLNQDRKSIEADMQREALLNLKAINFTSGILPYGLCLYDQDWHQGVIGILASRIKDKYHRPVIAFADDDSGNSIKGSARSIPGFHIRDALESIASKYPHVLSKFGGHAMAAGMSLEKKHYTTFTDAFDEEVKRHLKEADLQAILQSDGELTPLEFSLELAKELRDAAPWGQHFPEPLFDGEFGIVTQRIVGQKHLKLVLTVDESGQNLVDAIAFNIDPGIWPNKDIQKIRAVYKLDVNEFRGKESLQLMVEHMEEIV
jgi:single-stranded-DNA-specific exonuclease